MIKEEEQLLNSVDTKLIIFHFKQTTHTIGKFNYSRLDLLLTICMLKGRMPSLCCQESGANAPESSNLNFSPVGHKRRTHYTLSGISPIRNQTIHSRGTTDLKFSRLELSPKRYDSLNWKIQLDSKTPCIVIRWLPVSCSPLRSQKVCPIFNIDLKLIMDLKSQHLSTLPEIPT